MKIGSPTKTKVSSPTKKSPNKENTLNLWLSPKKQLLPDLNTQYGSPKKLKRLNNDAIDEKRQSHVKLIKNDPKKDYTILNNVDINHELNIFENDLELDNYDIKTTPTKSSSKVNVVNSPSRKSSTPNKSPIQGNFILSICSLVAMGSIPFQCKYLYPDIDLSYKRSFWLTLISWEDSYYVVCIKFSFFSSGVVLALFTRIKFNQQSIFIICIIVNYV